MTPAIIDWHTETYTQVFTGKSYALELIRRCIFDDRVVVAYAVHDDDGVASIVVQWERKEGDHGSKPNA